MADFAVPPEGLSVEEAFSLFDEGFGVTKSKIMRSEKHAAEERYKAGANGEHATAEYAHVERATK